MPSMEMRQALIDHLKGRGILSVFHYVPLHSAPMGIHFGGRPGQCPVTERISDTLLRLPFYNEMPAATQAEVVSAIEQFRFPAQTGTRGQWNLHTPAQTASDPATSDLANLAQACEDPAESRTASPLHK